MDLPVLVRSARDGEQVIRFKAAVLGAATTARPGAVRWTEKTVYRLPKASEEPPRGGYVVAEVGRSQVAHLPTCRLANRRRMSTWVRLQDEPMHDRMPCMECRPRLDPLDPGVLLERTRYQLLQARDAAALVAVLLPKGPEMTWMTGMTKQLVKQLRLADPEFDNWWTAQVEPQLPKE